MATTTVYLLAIFKRRLTISGVVSSAATEAKKTTEPDKALMANPQKVGIYPQKA